MLILSVSQYRFHNCEPNPNPEPDPNSTKKEKTLYTTEYQKHEPSGFCLYLKGLDGLNSYFKPIIHTKKSEDEDIALIFIKK